MAEIDLTDREQFEAWLHRQTREVCVAIAARAALRVLPSVILEFVTEPASPRNASALPILRALALALATAKHQNRWDELQPVAVRLPLGILEVVSLESHSGSAADWAYAAVDTIATTIGQEFTADSIRAIQRVLTIYGSADNVDQNRDLQIIEKGGSARFLANSPLLEDDEARSWHNSAWLSAKSRIVNLGQGWDVWTRWYDAVLDGKPTPGGEALDIYRVMLDSEEDWKQGPAHVNGLIRKREYELVPSEVLSQW